MGLKTENKIKMEGGMSSMTDLVFLLLIFFIVISTLISSGVNVDLPQESTSTSNDPKPLEVNITSENVYILKTNKEKEIKAKTYSELEQKIKANIDPLKQTVILKGHENSDWEYTVHVIDIAKKNNYKIALKDSDGDESIK